MIRGIVYIRIIVKKMNRVYDKSTILKKFYKFWINYLSLGNFNYWWNFGSIALVCLILQILTGVFLAMHYKSDIDLVFASVEYILRDVHLFEIIIVFFYLFLYKQS